MLKKIMVYIIFVFLISSNVFLCSYISMLEKKTEDKNKIVEIQGKEIASMKRSLEALQSQVSYLMMKEINDFLYNREDSASLTK